MKPQHYAFILALSTLLFSGCTFEDPNQPSLTYRTKTTSTSTTLTETSTTSTVTSTSTSTSETGSTSSTLSTTTTTLPENTYRIIAVDNKFTPQELELEKGVKTNLILENRDSRAYRLINEELKINWYLPPKINRTKSFTPEKADSFYLEDRKVGDMHLKIVVK
ncbi:MAG: hypothetical protein B6U72_03900 [Candidatus Altiarchaeales archaeon ex4484_2]|nr:MAG: hypothetical protein B6U72_03900 [Candidatus Altiarchaeales archaeon ex4484_2]